MSGTFQGANTLQFTPDNKQCYAYSGVVSPTNAVNAIGIDFTTNSEYIKGRVYFSIDNDDLSSGEQIGWKIMLNNQQITMTRVEASAADIVESALAPYFDVVIPPFTNFKAEAFTNGSSVDSSFVFTGTVHGAIEQLDLRLMNE